LVAPLLSKGKRSRKVVLPKGKWKSDSGKIYRGNTNIEIEVPLNRLPYFVKIK
jgi:alpha-glucosidase